MRCLCPLNCQRNPRSQSLMRHLIHSSAGLKPRGTLICTVLGPVEPLTWTPPTRTTHIESYSSPMCDPFYFPYDHLRSGCSLSTLFSTSLDCLLHRPRYRPPHLLLQIRIFNGHSHITPLFDPHFGHQSIAPRKWHGRLWVVSRWNRNIAELCKAPLPVRSNRGLRTEVPSSRGLARGSGILKPQIYDTSM